MAALRAGLAPLAGPALTVRRHGPVHRSGVTEPRWMTTTHTHARATHGKHANRPGATRAEQSRSQAYRHGNRAGSSRGLVVDGTWSTFFSARAYYHAMLPEHVRAWLNKAAEHCYEYDKLYRANVRLRVAQ